MNTPPMPAIPIIPAPHTCEYREGVCVRTRSQMRALRALPRRWQVSFLEKIFADARVLDDRDARAGGDRSKDGREWDGRAATQNTIHDNTAAQHAQDSDAVCRDAQNHHANDDRTQSSCVRAICGVCCIIDPTYELQHYTLTVGSDGITAMAGSYVGISYALKTLYQYVVTCTHNATVQLCSVKPNSARSSDSVPFATSVRSLTARYGIDRMHIMEHAAALISVIVRFVWRGIRRSNSAKSNTVGNSHAARPLSALSLEHSQESAYPRYMSTLPNIYIDDAPIVATRGFMLDISRDRVPHIRELRAFIRLLSMLKYNHIQLYTEHTFAYRGHRTVWKSASPLRIRHIRQLEAYAHEEGVELVPNQNCLGHMERWLKHKKYRHLSECPDGFVDPWGIFRVEPSTLNVTDPKSARLVADILHQYAPLFRSPRINIGCDEPWEFAQGVNKAHAQKVGADTLFLSAVNAIDQVCTRLQKKSYAWADIILKYPEKLHLLSDKIGLCLWGYEADHPFEDEIRTIRSVCPTKNDILLCCGTSNWNSISGRLHNARQNIANAVALCTKYELEGTVLTEWGDNGHFQQHPFIFLPAIIFAQESWGSVLKEHISKAEHTIQKDVSNTHLPSQSVSEETHTVKESLSQDDTQRKHISTWMDAYLFQHASHATQDVATIVYRLALINEKYQFNLINASVLHCVLQGDEYPYYRMHYPQFKEHDYDACTRDMQDIREKIKELPHSLVRKELLWTVDILRCAAQCIAHIASMETPTLAHLDPHIAYLLEKELAPLIARYKYLWRRRARRGGVKDSVARLKRALHDLQCAYRSSPRRH